jgi:predicted CxxxxCH...CXXCH cytochrome family protein
MMIKNFKYGVTALSATLLLIGCSELKNDSVPTKSEVSVHGKGFADTTNTTAASFHGKYIQSKNYDITTCRQCHGVDYAGGTSNQSCLSCHNKTGGPENCTTCHGSVNAAPPKDLADNTSPTVRGVGAHQKHVLGGVLGAPVACKECHVVPSKIYEGVHINKFVNVRFDSTSVFFKNNATYIAANVSCTNTYCHGNFNGGNLNRTMTWTDTTATVTACGTCHGDTTKTTVKEKAFPLSGHTAAPVTSNCWTCHSRVVNSSMSIIDPLRHVNGVVD